MLLTLQQQECDAAVLFKGTSGSSKKFSPLLNIKCC